MTALKDEYNLTQILYCVLCHPLRGGKVLTFTRSDAFYNNFAELKNQKDNFLVSQVFTGQTMELLNCGKI